VARRGRTSRRGRPPSTSHGTLRPSGARADGDLCLPPGCRGARLESASSRLRTGESRVLGEGEPASDDAVGCPRRSPRILRRGGASFWIPMRAHPRAPIGARTGRTPSWGCHRCWSIRKARTTGGASCGFPPRVASGQQAGPALRERRANWEPLTGRNNLSSVRDQSKGRRQLVKAWCHQYANDRSPILKGLCT